MGFRSFFRRRRTAADETPGSTAVAERQAEEPLTPGQLAELQEAWAELAEAAKGSAVNSLHACTRTGKPWQKDPAAVRSMAVLLRHVRDEDTTLGKTDG